MEKTPQNPNPAKQGFNNIFEIEEAKSLGMMQEDEYQLRKEMFLKAAGLEEVQQAYELGMIDRLEYEEKMGKVPEAESDAYREQIETIADRSYDPLDILNHEQVADDATAAEVDQASVVDIDGVFNDFKKGNISRGDVIRTLSGAFGNDVEIVGFTTLSNNDSAPAGPQVAQANQEIAEAVAKTSDSINEIANDILRSPEVKKLKKQLMALFASVMVLIGTFAFDNKTESTDAGVAAPLPSVELQHNQEMTVMSEGAELAGAEALKLDFESVRYSDEYKNHKTGDDIKFNHEAKEVLDNNRHGKYDIYPGIYNLEDLERAAYQSPELIAGLAMYDIPGFKLMYLDANGNELVADSNQEIDQAIKQMKNNPDLFGRNYDMFLSLIDGAKIQDTVVGSRPFNVYKYTERSTGETRLALGLGDVGEGLELKLSSGESVIFMKKCANIIVVKMKNPDTPLVVTETPPPDDGYQEPPRGSDETPPDVTPPNNHELPPTPPSERPTDPTHDTELEPKDPTKDINVNQNLPDQVKMGEQRVDSGGYRPAEDVTRATYDAPIAPENISQIINNQAELNQKIEEMSNSYEKLTEAEQQTLNDNQTGVGEVEKTYNEVDDNAKQALNENDTPVNQSENTGVVNGF